MLLFKDEDFKKLQEDNIQKIHNFVELKNNNEFLESSAYDEPRQYISLVIKYAMVGDYRYSHINTIISDIMTNYDYLIFFNEVHTKQEVKDFLADIITNYL